MITERIKKAIDIFLDAINEGTLAKGTCNACAVGNLVAHGMGITPIIYCDYIRPNAKWIYAFTTSDPFRDGNYKQIRNPSACESQEVQDCIDATEFSFNELADIEYAFESHTKIGFTDYGCHSQQEIRADQIRGLEAVVKVMLTFDDCKESVQEVFTSKAELIPVV